VTERDARAWMAKGRDESWPDGVFLEIATTFPDLWYENVHHRRLRSHIQALARGRDVLDAGCSTGLLCELALQSGARSVVGLDLGAERLEKARLRTRRYSPPARLEMADLQTAWPLDTAHIDLVVSSEVIEHLTPERRGFFVAEAYRVLRPGGTFLVTTPNVERWFTTTPVASGSWNPHQHWGELSQRELLALMQGGGFDAAVSYYRYPKVSAWIRRPGYERLADAVERLPPRRRLAMNLLGVGVRAIEEPSRHA